MTQGTPGARGDELLALILAGDRRGSVIANELRKEFYRGYPIEQLTILLGSNNEQALESGAWIASELARHARPILGHLLPLFGYPNARVKYYSVETVLTAATYRDGEVVGGAVSLITDRGRPVRQMAFKLLARADPPPLAACVPYIDDPQIAALLEWVLEIEGQSRDDHEIESRLRESDALGRVFAVVAAARVHPRSPRYLDLAVASDEDDVQRLADDELQWLAKLQEQTRRKQERAERLGAGGGLGRRTRGCVGENGKGPGIGGTDES